MWRAALFSITLAMTTPGGRAVLDAHFRQFLSLFAPQLSGSHATLVFMALSALGSLLLLRRPPARPNIYWIWREFRGEPGVETVSKPARG